MHSSDATLRERTTPYDEPVPRVQARALVGAMAGERYRLERLLGVGGMGAVYEARHLRLGTRVAVKVVHSMSGTSGERFEREARRAATLRHPGVASVHDYLVDPNVGACLVMELLEGETLGSRLRRLGKLPVPLCVALMSQLLDALEYVHRAGFVHRDLKPANLFLTGDPASPKLKLLDFGIARAIDPTPGESLTLPGTILGTLRYMAPEQALGSRALDQRADIYSVGALLYACVTGRPPYRQRQPLEILQRMRDLGPARLRDAPEACPAALRDAVDRALSFDPEDRFASATEFRDAIQPRPEGLVGSHTLIGWADLPTRGAPPSQTEEPTLEVPASELPLESEAAAPRTGRSTPPLAERRPSPPTFTLPRSSPALAHDPTRAARARALALVALSTLVSLGVALLWFLS